MPPITSPQQMPFPALTGLVLNQFLTYFKDLEGNKEDFDHHIRQFRHIVADTGSANNFANVPGIEPFVDGQIDALYGAMESIVKISQKFGLWTTTPSYVAPRDLAKQSLGFPGQMITKILLSNTEFPKFSEEDEDLVKRLVAVMAEEVSVHDYCDTKPYTDHWGGMKEEEFSDLAHRIVIDLNAMHLKESNDSRFMGLTREERIEDLLDLLQKCKGTVYAMWKMSLYEECLKDPRGMQIRFIDNQKNNWQKKSEGRKRKLRETEIEEQAKIADVAKGGKKRRVTKKKAAELPLDELGMEYFDDPRGIPDKPPPKPAARRTQGTPKAPAVTRKMYRGPKFRAIQAILMAMGESQSANSTPSVEVLDPETPFGSGSTSIRDVARARANRLEVEAQRARQEADALEGEGSGGNLVTPELFSPAGNANENLTTGDFSMGGQAGNSSAAAEGRQHNSGNDHHGDQRAFPGIHLALSNVNLGDQRDVASSSHQGAYVDAYGGGLDVNMGGINFGFNFPIDHQQNASIGGDGGSSYQFSKNNAQPEPFYSTGDPSATDTNVQPTPALYPTGHNLFTGDAIFNGQSIGDDIGVIYQATGSFAAGVPTSDGQVTQDNYASDYQQAEVNAPLLNIDPLLIGAPFSDGQASEGRYGANYQGIDGNQQALASYHLGNGTSSAGGPMFLNGQTGGDNANTHQITGGYAQYPVSYFNNDPFLTPDMMFFGEQATTGSAQQATGGNAKAPVSYLNSGSLLGGTVFCGGQAAGGEDGGSTYQGTGGNSQISLSSIGGDAFLGLPFPDGQVAGDNDGVSFQETDNLAQANAVSSTAAAQAQFNTTGGGDSGATYQGAGGNAQIPLSLIGTDTFPPGSPFPGQVAGDNHGASFKETGNLQANAVSSTAAAQAQINTSAATGTVVQTPYTDIVISNINWDIILDQVRRGHGIESFTGLTPPYTIPPLGRDQFDNATDNECLEICRALFRDHETLFGMSLDDLTTLPEMIRRCIRAQQQGGGEAQGGNRSGGGFSSNV